MKKITLSIIAACSFFTAVSQVVLTQNFTSPFNPAANGWVTNNQSTGIGTAPTWFQGNGAGVFAAFNGGINDYYGANFQNGTTPGDISNWLITPTLTLYNGAVLEFATRTSAGTPAADRLQIRMSTTGGTVFSTGGPTDISSFNNLMLDINPLLVTTAATAVNNGSVNGYPQSWTVYQVPVTGVTGTVTGRFAFRYFVTNGGPTGVNSNYIGLDAVRYTLPCAPVIQNVVSCANSPAIITTQGLPATTYSWSTGATTSSISVSPSVTTVYTLFPSNGNISCGTQQTATVTIGGLLTMTASTSNNSVCVGRTVTLSAVGSAAGTYTWISGTTPIGTGSSIVVTPNVGVNAYNVGSSSSTGCAGNAVVNVTGLPNPTVGINVSNSVVCVTGPSTTVSFTGTGASAYQWFVNNLTATGNVVLVPVDAQNATSAAVNQSVVTVLGVAANGCSALNFYTLTINRTPTVTASASKSVECVNNRTITLTATSIPSSNNETYSWSGSTVATGSLVNYSTNTTSGLKTFTVVATSGLGCVSSPVTRTVSVSLCTGIESLSANFRASATPNPFIDEINVSGVDGHLELFNSLGQLVLSSSINESTSLNTSVLAKGIYILKAYNLENQVEQTFKLLKN